MIVGFSLQNVEANRNQAKQGNLNVNYRHDIIDVEAAEVAAIDEQIARITFAFDIAYRQDEEDVAAVNFEGTVLWQQDADQLLEQWEENGQIDEQVSAVVANHIFRKCLTQAVGLADALDLPSPVPMPRIGNNQ